MLLDTKDFRAWFDADTFGRILDINGHKILGVLVKDCPGVNRQAEGTEGYSRATARLYLRAGDVKGVNAGQSVRVDGVPYVVKQYDDMAGAVLRISMEAVDP